MLDKVREYLEARLDVLYKDKQNNLVEIMDVEEFVKYLENVEDWYN